MPRGKRLNKDDRLRIVEAHKNGASTAALALPPHIRGNLKEKGAAARPGEDESARKFCEA